ncbi:hypothetical protein RvY_07316, partial [Ramazzottius varieornatus]
MTNLLLEDLNISRAEIHEFRRLNELIFRRLILFTSTLPPCKLKQTSSLKTTSWNRVGFSRSCSRWNRHQNTRLSLCSWVNSSRTALDRRVSNSRSRFSNVWW